MLSNELMFKMMRRFLLLQPGTSLLSGFAVVTIIPIIFLFGILWDQLLPCGTIVTIEIGAKEIWTIHLKAGNQKSYWILHNIHLGEKFRSRNVIISLSPSVAKVKVSHVQLQPCIILVSPVTCQDRVTVTCGSCFLTWLNLTWSVMAAECKTGNN